MSEQDHDDPMQSTEPSTTSQRTHSSSSTATGRRTLLTTTPTIQPTLFKLVVLLLVGMAVIGVLTVAPSLVAGAELASVARVGVGILLALGVIRYAVRVVILRRTTYTVLSDSVRREFALLLRTKTREVPYEKIRSHEYKQSRLQSLLGFGSIALNQGLGTLILSDVKNPDEVYDHIRAQVADESS
jgi:hypothetical protein